MTASPSAVRQAKLDTITFDDLLTRQRWFDSEEPRIDLDLDCFGFISCACQTQLAAACFLLSRTFQRPIIQISSTDLRSYLSRSGFFTAVEAVADIEPTVGPLLRRMTRRRGSSDLLIEVTRFSQAGELPPLLDQVVDTLQGRLGFSDAESFDVGVAVSEAAQNVLQHNEQGITGFLSMQVYRGSGGNFLQIGLADDGIGVRASLQRNPEFRLTDDVEAIKVASALGTSEYVDPTRGSGLHHLLQIAYRHEGTVQFRSGSGRVRFRMDKKRGWAFNVPAMQGVQIELSLPPK